MEEVIAKSAKSLYIVTYSIFLVFGLILTAVGALTFSFVDEQEAVIFGGVFTALGAVLFIMSVAYLIYFIKMSPDAIKLKDGKLYFRNGVVGAPSEIDYCRAKGMGLDGAMFDFGKLFISVNGKEFKLNFVYKTNEVVNRLFLLKAQSTVQANIEAKQNSETEVSAEEKTSEENNG